MMGLVDLYRATGKADYITLAGALVTLRGDGSGSVDDQHQNRVPLRQETIAVGHAVTGPYLWCGACDVYAETGEAALLQAVRTIFDDYAQRKMYVTGVLGALHGEPKAARHLHPSNWGSLDPDKLEEVKECRQLMRDVMSNEPANRGKPDPWITRLHGKGWTHPPSFGPPSFGPRISGD